MLYDIVCLALGLELHVVERCVFAIQSEQFVVFALLYNLTIAQHADDIGIDDGGEAVCHYDGGAMLHEVV